MKKMLAWLAAFGSFAPVAFAEGANDIDLTAATTFLNSYTNAIKTFFTSTTTVQAITGVVGCFLLLWIIGLIVVIVKKLGNKSK